MRLLRTYLFASFFFLTELSEAHSRCGNHDITEQDRFAQQRALSIHRTRPDNARITAATVPVCFFVLTPTDGSWNLTDAQLQSQLDALNVAYGPTSCCDTEQSWCSDDEQCSINTDIHFKMATTTADDGNGTVVDGAVVESVTDANACVVRIEDDDYAVSYGFSYDDDMKRALRKGGPDVLNVYFTRFLGGLLGYSSWPWDATGDTLPLDGIVCLYSSIPGGSAGGGVFGEGDTLAHEVGHWLGLFHTFQGGCKTSDGVSDTAPEAVSYSGCKPDNRPDTCSDDQGPDPIFNFMDYSDDLCMYEFTENQKALMLASWEIFRLGIGSSRNVVSLTRGVASDPLFMAAFEAQVYSLDVSSRDKVIECKLSGPEGDAEMYMSVDAIPSMSSSDCCASEEAFTSNESCTAAPKYVPVLRTRFPFLSMIWNWLMNIFGRGDNPKPTAVDADCDITYATTLYIGVTGYDDEVVQDVIVTCS